KDSRQRISVTGFTDLCEENYAVGENRSAHSGSCRDEVLDWSEIRSREVPSMASSFSASSATAEIWPALPLAEWEPTYHNLHMWSQIVGKVRMALTPRINHWWNVPLYVTARGLTTSPIPYGREAFEICFDFLDHKLVVDRCDGRGESLA